MNFMNETSQLFDKVVVILNEKDYIMKPLKWYILSRMNSFY